MNKIASLKTNITTISLMMVLTINDSANPAIAGAVTGAFGLVGALVVSLITTYCCHNKHCQNIIREKGKQTVVENKTVDENKTVEV